MDKRNVYKEDTRVIKLADKKSYAKENKHGFFILKKRIYEKS